MKNISYRIGDLELRRTETIGNRKYQYLEIVEWDKDSEQKDYCCTILIFEKEKEGFFIKSVLDRILIDKSKWNDLGILIKSGFKFLEGGKKYDKRNN